MEQILQALPDSIEKFQRISNLASDFTYAAKIYSMLIISEVLLFLEFGTLIPAPEVSPFALEDNHAVGSGWRCWRKQIHCSRNIIQICVRRRFFFFLSR